MKDELNGGGAAGGVAGSARRLARGGWGAMQEVAKAVKPRAVVAPRVRRGDAVRAAGGGAGLALRDLHDVYEVLSRWPAQDRGPLQRYAFDLALNRVLTRIAREGAGVVGFASMREVYAYAKRARRSAAVDAARHMEVVGRHRQEFVYRGGARMNGQYIEVHEREVAADPFASARLAELSDWLSARIGADDSALLLAVHVDGSSVAELSRSSGIAESTIRSRLTRGERGVRAQYEADGYSLN